MSHLRHPNPLQNEGTDTALSPCHDRLHLTHLVGLQLSARLADHNHAVCAKVMVGWMATEHM